MSAKIQVYPQEKKSTRTGSKLVAAVTTERNSIPDGNEEGLLVFHSM